MTTNVASLVTASGILIFMNGKNLTVGRDHPNFAKIQTALKNKDYASIPALADVVTSVRKWLNAGKDFELVGDLVTLNGVPFSSIITNKVLNMINAGASADGLFNFLRKVRSNPSKTAQDELLLFCEANGFMIHEDGDILAYKSVRGNYMDIHSGKFRNAVGDTVVMNRNQVDDRRDVTCSTGLHFAAFDYASTWAGSIDGVNRRLMVMKINPADVVSIPNDYKNQKGRCSKYKVIAEITKSGPLPKKEVYSNCDCGVVDAVAAEAARRAKVDAERVRLQAEITRLSAEMQRKDRVRAKWGAERDGLVKRINQVESLGGSAGDLRKQYSVLCDRIHQIASEIGALNTELTTARKERDRLR